MNAEPIPAGWAWPGLSKRAHYFPADSLRSLCGKWLLRGEREDTAHESPDNCAACKRARAKLVRP